MSGPNVDFYNNQIPSEPDGDFIENILTKWHGDYEKLEKNCAYIQWLFPNKQAGKNPASSPLAEIEAEVIRDDPEMRERVKRAFKMMLDYFGMKLDDMGNFKLSTNSDERLEHINVWGSDAFLYINRILLALKELGHERLMFPWMKFLADLVYCEKKLTRAELSFEQFWMKTMSPHEQQEMQDILSTMKE